MNKSKEIKKTVSSKFKAGLLLLNFLFASGTVLAERQIANHQEFTAILNDDQSCSEKMTIIVRHPSPDAFTEYRTQLQRLLGGTRIVLNLECPQVKGLLIIGEAAGKQVYRGALSSATEWVLIDILNSAEKLAVSSEQELAARDALETGNLESQQDEAQLLPNTKESTSKLTTDNNETNVLAASHQELFSHYGAKTHNGNLVVYSNPTGLIAEKEVPVSAAKILELILFINHPDLLRSTWWTSKLRKHLSASKQQRYIVQIGSNEGTYSWEQGGWIGKNEFEFKDNYQRFINEEVSGILSRAPKLPLRVVRVAAISLRNYDIEKQQFEIKRMQPHYENTGSALLPEIEGVDETMLGFEMATTLSYPADKARKLLDGESSVRLYEVITTDLLGVNQRKSEKSQTAQLSFVAKPVSSEIYYDKKLTKKFHNSVIKGVAAWEHEQSQVKQIEDTPLPLNWDTIFLLMLRDFPESVNQELFNKWAVRRAAVEKELWAQSDNWDQIEPWQPFFSRTSADKIRFSDVLEENLLEKYKQWSTLRATSVGEEVSMKVQYWNNQGFEPDRIPFENIARRGQFTGFGDIIEHSLNHGERDAVVNTLGEGWVIHGTWFSQERNRVGAIVYRGIRADQEIVIDNLEKDYTFELISRIGETVLGKYRDSPLRLIFIVPLEPVRLIVRNNQGEIVQTISFAEEKEKVANKRAEAVSSYPEKQLDVMGVKLGMSVDEARNIVAGKGLEISNNKAKQHPGTCGSEKNKIDKEVEKEKAAKTVSNTGVRSLRIKKLQQLPASCSEDLYDIFKLAFIGKKKYRYGLEDSVLVYVSEPKFGGKVVAVVRKFVDHEQSVDFLAKIKTHHGDDTYKGISEYVAKNSRLNFWFESGKAYYKVKSDKVFAKQCVPDQGPRWPARGMSEFSYRWFKVDCGKYMGYRLANKRRNHDLFLVDTSYVWKVRSASKSLYEKRKKVEEEIPF